MSTSISIECIYNTFTTYTITISKKVPYWTLKKLIHSSASEHDAIISNNSHVTDNGDRDEYDEERNGYNRSNVKPQRVTFSHLNFFGNASNGEEITVTIKLYTAKHKDSITLISCQVPYTTLHQHNNEHSLNTCSRWHNTIQYNFIDPSWKLHGSS